MSRESRKMDHIRFALDTLVQSSAFDDARFVHHSIPNSRIKDCDISTKIGELELCSPIFINAMTGGAIPTEQINRDFAVIARETGLAMAVGSQRAALQDPNLISTYRVVRDIFPDGKVIANLGAGATVEDAKRAIDMLRANALQLHLNVPQELVMSEGDRDFSGICERIAQVVDAVQVPVIIKEVGFGMSRETVGHLSSLGVRIVDVGGRGGTNFVDIENRRRTDDGIQFLSGWGQTTISSLLEAGQVKDMDIIASGGIRDALDMAKSLALGAKAVGVAGLILRTYMQSGTDAVIHKVNKWMEELCVIMTLLGCQDIESLKKTSLVIFGETADWCRARNIDIQSLANR